MTIWQHFIKLCRVKYTRTINDSRWIVRARASALRVLRPRYLVASHRGTVLAPCPHWVLLVTGRGKAAVFRCRFNNYKVRLWSCVMCFQNFVVRIQSNLLQTMKRPLVNLWLIFSPNLQHARTNYVLSRKLWCLTSIFCSWVGWSLNSSYPVLVLCIMGLAVIPWSDVDSCLQKSVHGSSETNLCKNVIQYFINVTRNLIPFSESAFDPFSPDTVGLYFQQHVCFSHLLCTKYFHLRKSHKS